MPGVASLEAEGLSFAHPNGAPRWPVYLDWSARVGVAFFAVYPAMNWITASRPARLQLYLPEELAVPFVPELIWVYLSMYALFLVPPLLLPAERMPALGKQLIAGTLASGLVFLLLPAELGFVRAIPDGSPSAAYALLFRLDRPHNQMPSLHVLFSAAIALACAECARPLVRVALHVWLAVIAASTLLVHQHHVIDLVSSFVLVSILRRLFR
jgi:membrane-associated phospholipid phosphatase